MKFSHVVAAAPYNYDMVIRNAEIYDGSGNESYIGDVGIKDGKITAIGKAAVINNCPTGVCCGRIYKTER